jgi:hypothetical protein
MTLSGVNPIAAKREKIAQAKAAKAQTFRALTERFLAAAEKRTVAERTGEFRTWRLDRHILPLLGDTRRVTCGKRTEWAPTA